MILVIDTECAQPIYEQLRDQIVCGIAANQLKPGEGLPSVRQLASDLGINLHTANKTYTALCHEGYIVMDRRRGAIVARNVQNSQDFLFALSKRLVLAAAEARCREIEEDTFIEICRESYQSLNAPGRLEEIE